MKTNKKAVVIGSLIVGLWMPLGARAIILVNDQFLDGSRADGSNPGETDTAWWAQLSGGASWNIQTDNTAPLSGSVLGNFSGDAPNTIMYGSFAPVTLGVNQTITFELDGRRTGASASANGVLILDLGYDGGTPFTADATTGPSGDDKMIWGTYLENYNNFPTTAPHHIVLQLTRRLDGNYDRLVTVDGVPSLVLPATVAASFNPTYQFNQAFFLWQWDYVNGGGPNVVDNILITVTVPEPATIGLLALGGLVLWRHAQRKTLAPARR
jgi:hypothetical protein